MSQENALIKSKGRDINKIVAFKNAKIDTVVQSAVEKVAKDFGYKIGAKTAVTKTTGKTSTTPKVITGAGATSDNPQFVDPKYTPKFDDLDVEKMGGKDKALTFKIAGRGIPKTGPYKGKWIAWRGNKN